MKYLLASLLFLTTLYGDELKIQANFFNTDQKSGLSTFQGEVRFIKGADELNASLVTVRMDQNNDPIEFVADGNVSFVVTTQEGSKYTGQAQKAIYYPKTKEYHFFKNVHLMQLDDNKEIVGDEIVLKSIEGTAYAKGAEKEPVIMIFDLKNKEESKEQEEQN